MNHKLRRLSEAASTILSWSEGNTKDALVSHVDARVVRFFFAIYKSARVDARTVACTVARACDRYKEIIASERLEIQVFK